MPNILTVHYPQTLPDILHKSREEFEQEAKLAMAAKLYEMSRLSSGQAADLVGISRTEFIYRLKDFGVALINYSENDLQEDFNNA